MRRTSTFMPDSARPRFELRAGGFRVTADRFPTRPATAVTTAIGSGFLMWAVHSR
ncbi:hypothetical protein [Streptomyces sp. CAU 1734]|uniref:hypothetical protein n=1 Tax=Streptomyces sp. CAU 1734 TaxID=3140360 RepID=UPI0032612100